MASSSEEKWIGINTASTSKHFKFNGKKLSVAVLQIASYITLKCIGNTAFFYWTGTQMILPNILSGGPVPSLITGYSVYPVSTLTT